MRHTVLHAMLLITSVTTSFLAWNYRQKARDIEQDVAQLHLHSFVTIKAVDADTMQPLEYMPHFPALLTGSQWIKHSRRQVQAGGPWEFAWTDIGPTELSIESPGYQSERLTFGTNEHNADTVIVKLHRDLKQSQIPSDSLIGQNSQN